MEIEESSLNKKQQEDKQEGKVNTMKDLVHDALMGPNPVTKSSVDEVDKYQKSRMKENEELTNEIKREGMER